MINYTAEDFIAGQLIHIDKDLGWTSFDVVNKIRVALRNEMGIKKIKVGHTGTLDPLATGLVILCTGKATKQIESYTGLDKEYIAQITFGSTTPSFDLETDVDQTFPYGHITYERLESALSKFLGKTEQVPPNFSAKQVNGQRAYNRARQGEEFELKKNLVTIYELDILKFELPVVEIRILCSKGTYIRSFANDLGKILSSGAHLSGLRRTKIGDFYVNDAEKVSDFIKNLKPL